MENKKYLDKVVGYIVRSTEIDYENETVIYSHLNPSEEETRTYCVDGGETN